MMQLVPGATLDATRPSKLTVERAVYASPQTGRALYKVHNSQDGLSYALKVIPAADAAELEQVRRETVALNRQNQHPECLPRYRGCWLQAGHAYVLLDWMDGVPLHELTRGRAVSGVEDARLRLQLAFEACQSVALLHRNGFKHRDLKPDNLLARDVNQPARGVAVIDLGLSTLARSEQEGTRGYHAPEQSGMRNQNLTTATDVFALGQVTWYLLTGASRQLIQAEGKADWGDSGPELSELLPSVQGLTELERTLHKACAFRPEQRPAHAGLLAAALRNAVRPLRG